MARSTLAPVLILLAAAAFLSQTISFVPAPSAVPQRDLVQQSTNAAQAAYMGALVSTMAAAPAYAVPEDDEGFDFRILAVLFFPLVAASWALFNVWRVAARQVVRFSSSTDGSAKQGLRSQD